MEPVALRFTQAVQRVAAEARRLGLEPPGFRAPPRLTGYDRTIRRLPAGGAVIAIRLQGRSYEAIVADVVEGVVVAAGLDGAEAIRVRRALSLAAGGQTRAA